MVALVSSGPWITAKGPPPVPTIVSWTLRATAAAFYGGKPVEWRVVLRAHRSPWGLLRWRTEAERSLSGRPFERLTEGSAAAIGIDENGDAWVFSLKRKTIRIDPASLRPGTIYIDRYDDRYDYLRKTLVELRNEDMFLFLGARFLSPPKISKESVGSVRSCRRRHPLLGTIA